MFRHLRKLSVPQISELFSSQRKLRSNTSENSELLYFNESLVEIHRRAYKRSISVSLQVNGRIKISAPKLAPLQKILSFLSLHAEWIRKHQGEYEDLRRKYPPKRYVAGEEFLFMGQLLPLHFVRASSGQRKIRIRLCDAHELLHGIPKAEGLRPTDLGQGAPSDVRSSSADVFAGEGDVREGKERRPYLICEIPPDQMTTFEAVEVHPEIATMMMRFFERAGRDLLVRRVQHFSERMKLYPKTLSFRSQKTRWGSCSSDGCLSLNWRLVIAPLEVIDYVVVHELAHLRYYNHSPNFWYLVGQHCADYKTLRDWLKVNQYEADFLARSSELHR